MQSNWDINIFWWYIIGCYVFVGFYLALTNGSAAKRISEKRGWSEKSVANQMFIFAPYIVTKFLWWLMVEILLIFFFMLAYFWDNVIKIFFKGW